MEWIGISYKWCNFGVKRSRSQGQKLQKGSRIAGMSYALYRVLASSSWEWLFAEESKRSKYWMLCNNTNCIRWVSFWDTVAYYTESEKKEWRVNQQEEGEAYSICYIRDAQLLWGQGPKTRSPQYQEHPSPPAAGLREHCKLPHWAPSLGRKCIFVYFELVSRIWRQLFWLFISAEKVVMVRFDAGMQQLVCLIIENHRKYLTLEWTGIELLEAAIIF